MIVESVIQIKSRTMIHVDVSVKVLKNIMCAKKTTFGFLLHVGNSEEVKATFKGKLICKTKNVYILLDFLLITIALLIAVSI